MSETKKHPGGRPTVMTPEVLNKLSELLRDSCPILIACDNVGISHQTYYDYVNSHPEFLEKIEALKNSTKYLQRRNVRKFLEENDKDMTKWYGQYGMNEEYGEKKKLEHTGLTKEAAAAMTDEELDDYLTK